MANFAKNRHRTCQEMLIFYFITLPALLMFSAQHLSLVFVDSFSLFSASSRSGVDSDGSGSYPNLFGDLADGNGLEDPPNQRFNDRDVEDLFATYLTQSVGRNLSETIRNFLHYNPVPPVPDIDEFGNEIAAMPLLNENGDLEDEDSGEYLSPLLLATGASSRYKRRQRRYIIRDPNELNGILTELTNARNWSMLSQQVQKLAGHFWYGEWCGVGWSKINDSQTQCCKCRDGVKSQNVDTTLIRNTANDCIKCGAHPIDPVDTSCMLHDICYTCTQSPFDYMMANCECERIISYAAKAADCTRSVSKLYPEMNETMRYRWCTFYKGAIPLLFENKPCYCPRNGQPYVAFSLKMCDKGHLLIPVKAK